MRCGVGVAARVWMRIISTDPQFTWGGSLAIVLVATIPGIGMGVVLATRRWRRTARAVGVVTVLPLGIGIGIVMLPTIALGAVAMRQRCPRRRAVIGGLAVLSAGFLVGLALLDELSATRAAVGFAVYLGLMAWMSAMLAVRTTPRAAVVSWEADGRAALAV